MWLIKTIMECPSSCRNPVYFQDFFNYPRLPRPRVVEKRSQSRLFSGFFQHGTGWRFGGISHGVAIPFIFRIFSTQETPRHKDEPPSPSQSRLFSGFFQHEENINTVSQLLHKRRNPVYFQDFFNTCVRRTVNVKPFNIVAIPFIFRIFSTQRRDDGGGLGRMELSQSRLFSGFFQLVTWLALYGLSQVSQSRLFSGFFQPILRTQSTKSVVKLSQSRLFSGFFQRPWPAWCTKGAHGRSQSRLFSGFFQPPSLILNPVQHLTVAIPFIFRIFSTSM